MSASSAVSTSSASTSLAAAAPIIDLFSHLPKSILQHSLTQQFLSDRDAVALAHTRCDIFTALRDSYQIRSRQDYYIMYDEEVKFARVVTINPKSPHHRSEIHTIAISDTIDDSHAKPNDIIRPRLKFRKVGEEAKGEAIKTDLLVGATPSSSTSSAHSQSPRIRFGIVHHAALPTANSISKRTKIKYRLNDIEDFNFLPSSIRSLTIGPFMEEVYQARLPSMSQLTRLHTITFESTLSFYLTQPDDGSIWPSSLRTLIFRQPRYQPQQPEPDQVRFPASLTKLFLPELVHCNDQLYGLFFSRPYNDGDSNLLHFPPGLVTLHHPCMNHPIEGAGWSLPDSLTELSFGTNFNYPLGAWKPPSSLRSLHIGWLEFDQSIADVHWPDSLTKLNLGEKFNQPISSVRFPSSLQELRLCTFDHPLPDLRHTSLRELYLGYSWNQSTSTLLLPDSVTIIEFSRLSLFNQSMDEFHFPCSLTSLLFAERFVQPLHACTFPSSLTQLKLASSYPLDLLKQVKFPPHLRQLGSIPGDAQLMKKLIDLPIETMEIDDIHIIQPIAVDSVVDAVITDDAIVAVPLISLPSTLTHLTMNDLGSLVRSLRFHEGLQSIMLIQLVSSFVDVTLPSSLCRLVIAPYSDFNAPFPPLAHTHLRELRLPSKWNQEITSSSSLSLPETLEILDFGNRFDRDITHLRLPQELKELRFGWSSQFSQSLSSLHLPPHLEVLQFGSSSTCFTHLTSLMTLSLPSSLRVLTVPQPAGFKRALAETLPVVEYKAWIAMVSTHVTVNLINQSS